MKKKELLKKFDDFVAALTLLFGELPMDLLQVLQEIRRFIVESKAS